MRNKLAFYSENDHRIFLFQDIFDVINIILPGGSYEPFAQSQLVGEILKEQESGGCLIAAICAAPLALHVHKIGFGKALTSWPSARGELIADYKYVDGKLVVHDGTLIASRGPGAAFQSSPEIVNTLIGEEISKQVANAWSRRVKAAILSGVVVCSAYSEKFDCSL